LTTEFLSDKPKFSEVINEFCEYIKGAEIVIHNAPFDISFLNAEFARAGLGLFTDHVESLPIPGSG
jgi:DNA polymerase-3 subunit epsilon